MTGSKLTMKTEKVLWLILFNLLCNAVDVKVTIT